jgi:threonine synthase
VTLSTASAYKFPAAVLSALGEKDASDSFASLHRLSALTSTEIPPNLAALETAEVLHTDVIDKDEMQDYVLSRIGR